MNKTELIDGVAAAADLSKAEAGAERARQALKMNVKCPETRAIAGFSACVGRGALV